MDQWNVVILGEDGVGKTALVQQLVMEAFDYDHVIDEANRKQLSIDDQLCMLEIIDTSRQEHNETQRNFWVTYIHGFILVYSITSHRSFERVEAYYQDVVRTKGGAPKFILVGNKVDKLNQREVSSEEGYGFARRLGCRFFETSAKTRVNVEEAFSSLVRTLRDPEATKPETPTGMASRGGVRGKGEKETRKRWQNRCIVF